MKLPRSGSEIWVPRFDLGTANTLFNQAIADAKLRWQGETRIWLLPGIKTPKTWAVRQGDLTIFESALPSKIFNCIGVYHLDGDGGSFPNIRFDENNEVPNGLYKIWLATQPQVSIAKNTVSKMVAPLVVDGEIALDSQGSVQMSPMATGHYNGPIMPLEAFDSVSGAMRVGWRGLPKHIDGVFNVDELLSSKNLRHRNEIIGGECVDIFEDDRGNLFTRIEIRWPEPFDSMLLTGVSATTFFHHLFLMRRCIELLQGGKSVMAERLARRWFEASSGKIDTKFEPAWLAPKLRLNPDEIVKRARSQLQTRATTLSSLMVSTQYQHLRRQETSVDWHLGWLSYFWYELYQDIVSGRGIRACTRCGKLLFEGRRNKKICNKIDNPTCWAAYDAERARNSYHDRKRNSEISQ